MSAPVAVADGVTVQVCQNGGMPFLKVMNGVPEPLSEVPLGANFQEAMAPTIAAMPVGSVCSRAVVLLANGFICVFGLDNEYQLSKLAVLGMSKNSNPKQVSCFFDYYMPNTPLAINIEQKDGGSLDFRLLRDGAIHRLIPHKG